MEGLIFKSALVVRDLLVLKGRVVVIVNNPILRDPYEPANRQWRTWKQIPGKIKE